MNTSRSKSRNKSQGDEYGIGAVAKLTGLSDHTIRVWERRYEAVVAGRSGSGRRVYRTADVEKLRLLKLLTDKGVTISRIAGDSTEELKARLASMNDLATRAGLEELSVALMGDFLPGLVRERGGRVGPLDFTIVETDMERFEADLQQRQVDVLVLEVATIAPTTLEHIDALLTLAGARQCVVVYTFARSRDIDALAARDIVLLRAPVRLDEVANALVKLAVVATEAGEREPELSPDESGPWSGGGDVTPRRFDSEQLSRLARITSSIDCECPQHLASLVAQLSAFEIYSASCASRDENDRALHQYLHRSTASARAEVEEALMRVVVAEGIEL